MEAGSQAAVTTVTGSSAPEIARGVLKGFEIEPGENGLMLDNGVLYEWYAGERWEARPEGWLETELWRRLETAVLQVTTVTEGGGTVVSTGRLKGLTGSKVRDAAKAILSYVESAGSMPRWIGGGHGKPDPRKVMVFKDQVVDIWATARGFRETGEYRWVTHPKDWRWFGSPSLRVAWEPEAQAPWWEQSTKEWGGGEPLFTELLERAWAAACMPYREWARFVVQYGATRGGKGTGAKVLRQLLGGRSYMGIRTDEMLEKHMGVALLGADVLVVSEMGELEGKERDKFAGMLRSMLGRDETTLNPKNKAPLSDVVLKAFPIIQSHYILNLPNEQGGLSSKMLPLHYKVSWKDNPDYERGEKLQAELAGIAARLARAAVRLVAASAEERWPITEASRELKLRIESEGNPVDAFLEWGFIRVEDGWVGRDLLVDLRKRYEKENHVTLKTKTARVPDMKLLGFIEERTSWGAQRTKRKLDGTYGLQGIRVKGDKL